MDKNKTILGWLAVGFSLVVSSQWAYWGIVEGFQEGRQGPGPGNNVLGAWLYLLPLVLAIGLSVYALRFPTGGGLLYVGLGVLFNVFIYLIWKPAIFNKTFGWFPVTGLLIPAGLLFWIGKPKATKLAYGLVIGLPLLAALAFGIGLASKEAGRGGEENREPRLVEGNGVRLIWAPAGPGWPDYSVGWEDAKYICLHLSEDGKTVMKTPQNIWRLPSVEEAVRSMSRHGRNCGGEWNPLTLQATYKMEPLKGSPLGSASSPIIHWLTSTEKDENTIFWIDSSGDVVPADKSQRSARLGFRAVKESRSP